MAKEVIKCIGDSESEGIYTPNGGSKSYPFHNLILHTTREGDKYTHGLRAEQLKIKYDDLEDVLDLELKDGENVEDLHPADFGYLIGACLRIGYGRFKDQIVSVEPFDPA